jgi:hypothetical protein
LLGLAHCLDSTARREQGPDAANLAHGAPGVVFQQREIERQGAIEPILTPNLNQESGLVTGPTADLATIKAGLEVAGRLVVAG